MSGHPAWDLDTKHWVYAYWRADGQLLYVGLTAFPESRHEQHIRTSAWFSDVDRYELIASYPSGKAGFEAESAYIRDRRPLYNLRGNPANKGLVLPVGTWLLPTTQVGQAIYEAVNEQRLARAS